MLKYLGIILFTVVSAATIVFTELSPSSSFSGISQAAKKYDTWQDIALFYGGEKTRLLKNAKTQVILAQYKIRLDAVKAGSIEMATTLNTQGKACLWPSNQIVVNLARNQGKNILQASNIFNSALVFYTWKPITQVLQKSGIVTQDDTILRMDTAKFFTLIMQQKSWKKDLGIDVYGNVRLFSTNPKFSNSGNIFAALLASTLNNGKVVTQQDLPNVLPKVQTYFKAMGYMEHSSGDIFENFLKQGMGAKPIIVGYENQLIEFVIENQQYRNVIRDKIDIIYPTPTIFASHPLILLDSSCNRLVEALQDQALQAIAWQEHGFRSGLFGVDNDPNALSVSGIQKTINQIIPMPSAEVMQQIIDVLE